MSTGIPLLVAWYPVAQASRKLFPDAIKALDAAAGGAFPFTKALVERRTLNAPLSGWRGSAHTMPSLR